MTQTVNDELTALINAERRASAAVNAKLAEMYPINSKIGVRLFDHQKTPSPAIVYGIWSGHVNVEMIGCKKKYRHILPINIMGFLP